MEVLGVVHSQFVAIILEPLHCHYKLGMIVEDIPSPWGMAASKLK
jgi:hypothetical protein